MKILTWTVWSDRGDEEDVRSRTLDGALRAAWRRVDRRAKQAGAWVRVRHADSGQGGRWARRFLARAGKKEASC